MLHEINSVKHSCFETPLMLTVHSICICICIYFEVRGARYIYLCDVYIYLCIYIYISDVMSHVSHQNECFVWHLTFQVKGLGWEGHQTYWCFSFHGGERDCNFEGTVCILQSYCSGISSSFTLHYPLAEPLHWLLLWPRIGIRCHFGVDPLTVIAAVLYAHCLSSFGTVHRAVQTQWLFH